MMNNYWLLQDWKTLYEKERYVQFSKTCIQRQPLGNKVVSFSKWSLNQSPKNPLVRSSLLGKTWSGHPSLSNCRTSAKWQADE